MVRCIAWWYHLLSNVYDIRLRSRCDFLLKRKRVKKIHGYTTPFDSALVFSKKGEYFGSLLLKVLLRIGLSYQNNTSDYNLEKDLEIIWSQLDSQITDITNYICYFKFFMNDVWSLMMQNRIQGGIPL